MGKFYSATVATTDVTQRITNISNWFNNLEGVSSEVVDYRYNDVSFKAANISIDNSNIEILFGICVSDIGITVCHVKNGEDVNLISDNYITGATQRVTEAKLNAFIDNNCIMLSVFQGNDYNPSENGVEVVYIKTTNNKYLVGYQILTNGTTGRHVSYTDISNLTFEDSEDSVRIPYTYTNMFPYTAAPGTIKFADEALFVNGNGYEAFSTEALKECSTVSLLSTQSLLSMNCVALGAHCLAPLDNE